MQPSRRLLALLNTAVGPFVALLVVVAFFSVADWLSGGNTFFTAQNFRTVAKEASIFAVAALGMTLIVISGGIDSERRLRTSASRHGPGLGHSLRCGASGDHRQQLPHGIGPPGRSASPRNGCHGRCQSGVASRSGSLAGKPLKLSWPKNSPRRKSPPRLRRTNIARRGDVGRLKEKLSQLEGATADIKIDNRWFLGVHNHWATAPAALLMCVATGVAAGLINGFLISTLGVIPFIVTLGTMTLFLGLGKLIPDVPIRPEISEIPRYVRTLTLQQPQPAWLVVASGVWLALLLAALLSFVLRYTVLGRHVFAIGSNEAAARLCGINVPRVKLAVYGLAGLFVGISGIYNFSLLSQGDPTTGIGVELKVIAAVVIGGTSLSGGRGSVVGRTGGRGADDDNHVGLHAARLAQSDSGRDRGIDHRRRGDGRSDAAEADSNRLAGGK